LLQQMCYKDKPWRIANKFFKYFLKINWSLRVIRQSSTL
jgi:hypothetical protein